MRTRLPLVFSSAALVVALLGSTPLGHAAANAVPWARNADRVDGFHAKAVPTAGTLLPLGRDAKFPANVVPRTLQPKPTRAWASYRASGPNPIPALGDLAHLSLPTANVVVRAKAAFSLTSTYAMYEGPAIINCHLTVGSEEDSVLINVPLSSYEVPSGTINVGGSVVVPFEVAAHGDQPRTAVFACERAGLNYGSGNVSVRAIRISAMEIDQLTNSAED